MTERLVLCTDPGNCTGLALGVDGRLVWCGWGKPGDELELPAEYQSAMVRRVLGFAAVYELPKFYHPKKYKKAHIAMSVGNALIREAVTLGEWKNQARKLGARCIEIYPSDWKGQVKKDVMVERVLRRLTPDERALFDALALPPTKAHNVADAIGMFLKVAGRLERDYGTTPWVHDEKTKRSKTSASATQNASAPIAPDPTALLARAGVTVAGRVRRRRAKPPSSQPKRAASSASTG